MDLLVVVNGVTVGLISFLVGLTIGHRVGVKDAYRAIMKSLGVPKGARITGVQFTTKK